MRGDGLAGPEDRRHAKGLQGVYGRAGGLFVSGSTGRCAGFAAGKTRKQIAQVWRLMPYGQVEVFRYVTFPDERPYLSLRNAGVFTVT